MANHDNYVIQGNTLDAIASEVKTLADTSDKISPSEMREKLGQVNADVETQTDLIAQIQMALEGKAAGGGGNTDEIENIIDASGVLDSTDGTATEKVEQLIDKAEDENAWYQYTGTLTDIPRWTNATCETLPRMNLSKITSLSYKFSGMPNLKRSDYYINSENCTRADNVFSNSKQLEYVKGLYTAKCTNVEAMFNNCVSLKTIEEPLDFSSRNDKWQVFVNCSALENVRFVPECIHTSIIIPSPVLSIGNVFDLTDTENVGSVQSIINGLVTLAEDATAQTLTLSKNLPLTEEQKQAITTAVNNKGWTLAFA